MAETLREPVVALSLDSSNFSRNMRTINQQIRNSESTFRPAGVVYILIPQQIPESFVGGSIT